jgi:hypothetical protein
MPAGAHGADRRRIGSVESFSGMFRTASVRLVEMTHYLCVLRDVERAVAA